ncbi:ABC transporter ATP-binding protein, partial [bacterium]
TGAWSWNRNARRRAIPGASSVSSGTPSTRTTPFASGKSTLLRCLAGLLPLANGVVRVDGVPLETLDAPGIARRLAFLFQVHAPVLPFTVREVVSLGRTPHIGWFGSRRASDSAIVDAALHELSLEAFAERPYTELSGGERQLVLLARALAQQPRVLLMDEPAAHFDLANQVRCLDLIRRLALRGVAVIVTTHDPNHATVLGGRAVLMNAGEAAVVGPVETTLTAEALSRTYAVPIQVFDARHPEQDAGVVRRFSSPW